MQRSQDFGSRDRFRKLIKLALYSTLGAGFIAVAGSAMAQQDAASETEDELELDRVKVTGSRISRAQIEGPSPVYILTADEMQKEGFTTVYEALNTLTQNVGNMQDDQYAGGFTQNANVVDLRGLGPGRTLVLINGRRTTDYPLPFNGQSNIVNLNSIPIAAVERVEVLAGGASAVYGSDAVAGVINVVMKSDLDSTDVRLRYGDTVDGGGKSIRAQVVGGVNNDRGNFTYALEYFKRDPIWGFQRDFMDSIEDNPDGPPFVNSRNVLALDAFDAFRVGSVGLRYIAPPQQACDAWPELEYSFRPGAGNYCGRDDDISQFTVRNGTENWSGFFNGEYELTDRVQAFGYLSYIRKDSKFNTATPFWSSNQFGPNVDGATTYSNLDNIVTYDLSPFGIGLVEWPQVTLLQRIFTASEMGGREANNDNYDEDSYDFVAGLRGDFAATWEWETAFQYSAYDVTRERRLIVADLADAFFAGDFLTNLEPDPLFGGFFANLGDLTDPNNPFLKPVTPGEYASFTDIDTTTADSSNSTINFTVNGDLFDLPAGTVSMAAIAEWGTQEYDIQLDSQLIAGEFWGYTGTGGGGERDRYAVGTEFLVPIIDMLTASAAVRYDKYDDITEVDDAVTYGFGLEFRPMQDLLVRGRFATSFRAPDMHYVFADPSGFFVVAPDYYVCAKDLGIDEDSPGGLSACIDPVRGDLGSSSIQGARAGNPFLEEEEGESFTFGFVWELFDGLSWTVDYYDIKLENIVQDRSIDQLLRDERACRLGGEYEVTPGTSCDVVLANITRFPVDGGINSETLISVLTGPFNQAVQETNGIDTTVNYALMTDSAGLWTFELAYTYVFDEKAAALPTDPVESFQDGGTQDFKDRGRVTVSWAYGDFGATVFMNYLGESLTADSLSSTDLVYVDPQYYFNLSLLYNITDQFNVSFIGNNIFNNDPPLTGGEEYPYFNVFNYDPYGTEWFIELGYTF
jgi:iron complex outermembrane receptor protein